MGWLDILLVVALITIVALLPLLLLYVRRRWLTGQGGVFDCALQLKSEQGAGGWSLGWARYRGEEVQWYRAFSLAMAPKLRLHRRTTDCEGRRAPAESEAFELYEQSIILRVVNRSSGEQHHLAMSRESAMAFISWLEAAPPGSIPHRF